jgi:hypothetical protein
MVALWQPASARNSILSLNIVAFRALIVVVMNRRSGKLGVEGVNLSHYFIS